MVEKGHEFASLYNQHDWIIGIDEAGWGPIAGPMISAAVAFPSESNRLFPKFIKDSKKLSESRRKRAFDWICQNAVYINFVESSPELFSTQGAARVREKAFRQLLDSVGVDAELSPRSRLTARPAGVVLIDGDWAPSGYSNVLTVVKGDTKVPAISAASIVAKVVRDLIMVRYSKLYPEFKWEANKGYATKDHFEALRRCGATPLHRLNVKKVKDAHKYGDKAPQ